MTTHAKDVRSDLVYFRPWLTPAERDEAERIVAHPVLTRRRAARLCELYDIAERRRGANPALIFGVLVAVAILLTAVVWAAVRIGGGAP